MISLNKETVEKVERVSKIAQEAFLKHLRETGGPSNTNHISPDIVKWHSCPACGQKLCRIDADSKAHKIYLWCKHCKKEVEVNI